jgi:photosystem II stability/assembly factor-like uncharacterized protein
VAAAAVAAAIAWPATAHGHGAFPAPGLIVVHPSDDQRVLVRTTYGLTETRDRGATWTWVCPEVIEYNPANETPPVGWYADDTLVVGTFDGLSVSADHCDWDYAGAGLADRYFVSVVTNQAGTEALALSSNGVGPSTFEVIVWESDDPTSSWAQRGTSPVAQFLGVSMAIAPSDPDRIYIAGQLADGMGGYAGVVQRSDDGGQTWSQAPIPGSEQGDFVPAFGGVDPSDPERAYLLVRRSDGTSVVDSRVLVTSDGAQTWEVAHAAEDLRQIAISPDGAVVAVGGPDDGLLTADATTLQFAAKNPIHVLCLTWDESGLFACADQFRDGYSVGVSEDEGETFTALAQLSTLCGPSPHCGAESDVGGECAARWPTERAELAAECPSGATSGGATGEPPVEADGTCNCRVGGRSSRDAWWLALVALLLRRRR